VSEKNIKMQLSKQGCTFFSNSKKFSVIGASLVSEKKRCRLASRAVPSLNSEQISVK
jgi:hypothetical protein